MLAALKMPSLKTMCHSFVICMDFLCRFMHRDERMSKDSIVFTKVELHKTFDTHLSNTKLMVYLFAIKRRYAL